MSKEIRDIVGAFKLASAQGRKAALATVVHVKGSSYRRPGARMLVEDNGWMTGAISGGCLEGDALRKALQAMNQGGNKLVTYDTSHEDDLEFGVQLGCNGIVHILFEPIEAGRQHNPIALLEKFLVSGTDAVLLTLFSLDNVGGLQPGTCFFLNDSVQVNGLPDGPIAAILEADAVGVLAMGKSTFKDYPKEGITAFFDLLQPPVSLIVVGAGNDALPLVAIATVLGWDVCIADGRPSHANALRFPKVSRIIVGKPDDVARQLSLNERTVIVLMTHNYHYDLELLAKLLPGRPVYIGTLGPKQRLLRMLDELGAKGLTITEAQRSAIYGPTGLDIGAETSEEIALSIIAEITSVLTGRPGGSLRLRGDAIHERSVAHNKVTKNE